MCPQFELNVVNDVFYVGIGKVISFRDQIIFAQIILKNSEITEHL